VRFDVVVIGGGAAGITVAARLRRAGVTDLAIVEPSPVHHYQPLWTLVGGGLADVRRSVLSMADVMPKGTHWIRASASGIDPERDSVLLEDGRRIGYRVLIMASGIHLDWHRIPGLPEAVARGRVCSVYRSDLAQRTWHDIVTLREGTAVFTVPPGPVKCASAGQKIAYLACDYWRREGREVQVHLVLPGARSFYYPEYADILDAAIDRWGIVCHLASEVSEVDGAGGKIAVRDAEGFERRIPCDLLHVVPPQSAPDWVAASPLARTGAGAGGFVEVDRHTLQHSRFPKVFAIGDVAGTPNVKTGAAIRKQAPVVVRNALAALSGLPPQASYHGYTCCPMVTSRNQLLLAELDYEGPVRRPIPGWPRQVIDPHLWTKRYGLPLLYRLMLQGRA